MKCDKYERLVSLYLDGRLDRVGEEELREHLSTCPRCSARLAALEAAQRAAKAAVPESPPTSYWDSFSNRVMTRIATGRKRREETGWRGWLASILPPPGRRLRFAAGVASIVVAIAAGVLYLERQGERVMPAVVRAPVEIQTPTEEKTPARSEDKDSETAGQSSASKDALREEREGGAPATSAAGNRPATGKAEQAPAPVELKETPAAKTEAASRAVTQEISPPAPAENWTVSEAPKKQPEPAAAGNETEAFQGPRDEKAAPPATEKLQRPGSAARSADQAVRMTPASPISLSGGGSLPTVTDKDTTISADDLRTLIAKWSTRIEENPADTQSDEGYRQVATAYCLLARKTGESADIDEGVKLIETYLARVQDPATKDFLTAKLEEIRGLKKR